MSNIVIDQENSGDDTENFVEEVDLSNRVLRLAGMLDEQRDQTDVRVQGMETLGADESR